MIEMNLKDEYELWLPLILTFSPEGRRDEPFRSKTVGGEEIMDLMVRLFRAIGTVVGVLAGQAVGHETAVGVTHHVDPVWVHIILEHGFVNQCP